MNLSETADLLSAMSAFDRRTIGDGDVIAWQAVLPDAAFEDCLEAIKRHYAEHTEWMMPAHVRHLVRDIVQERNVSPWAPGQHGVPRDQAVPEVTPGPRLALSDLPGAVAGLLARVRVELPEGSREALMPRTVAWEREHAAFRRQKDAEPNPRYRPVTTCPGGIAARRDPDHSNVLRHEDGSFCGHIPVDRATERDIEPNPQRADWCHCLDAGYPGPHRRSESCPRDTGHRHESEA